MPRLMSWEAGVYLSVPARELVEGRYGKDFAGIVKRIRIQSSTPHRAPVSLTLLRTGGHSVCFSTSSCGQLRENVPRQASLSESTGVFVIVTGSGDRTGFIITEKLLGMGRHAQDPRCSTTPFMAPHPMQIYAKVRS